MRVEIRQKFQRRRSTSRTRGRSYLNACPMPRELFSDGLRRRPQNTTTCGNARTGDGGCREQPVKNVYRRHTFFENIVPGAIILTALID